MPKKLGSDIYLFESKHKSNICLISAHGYDSCTSFKVPQGVALKFYTCHGYALTDPGINFLQRGGQHSVSETVKGGKTTYNYILTKYQGSHNKTGESYQQIKDVISTNDSMISALASDDLSKLERAFAKTLKAINVATIRNRTSEKHTNIGNFRGSTLSWVIDEVRKARPDITEFHCSFCRSTSPKYQTIKNYQLGGI